MPPINRNKIHAAKVEEAHKTLFDEGIKIRRAVAGASYVDASLERHTSTFSKPLQELVTEVGWGWIWSRPGLDRKQRSLLNLGMLCALNRSTELGVHVKGALRNGLSEEEIREVLLQVGVYVGLPASMEAFRVAEKVLEEWKKEGKPKAKL
ncbi:CMD-domain-containing protein [Ophiobolus disseminans]|uniref:CMD-domain-containing protein n=1 Tax=Ophiobolus disseminans TaxID=1469910 RepID=A0A6A7A2M0_9PLEO|nr:CMD-domain-containing protein [Ophiobolus disseminans]